MLSPREQRPDDARVLGRERDRDDVVRAAPSQTFHPATLGIATLRCDSQHGAGAVDEQGAQVNIAMLSHGTEPLLAASGMLQRREPEPSGELTAVTERSRIADGGDDRGGGHGADTLELHQPLGRLTGASQSCNAPIIVTDADIEFGQEPGRIGEDFASDAGNAVLAILNDRRQSVPQAIQSDADDQPILSEQTAQAIGERSALFDQPCRRR